MVALEHDATGRRFLARHAGRSGALHLDVLVEDLAIQFDGHKFRMGRLLAAGIELGGDEIDLVFLPLTGLLAGVGARGLGSIDRSHVAPTEFLDAVAVEDLNLVFTHHVDAGVGAFGDEDLEFDAAAAPLLLRVDIEALPVAGDDVDEGLQAALLGFESLGVILDQDGSADLPLLFGVSLGLERPTGEVLPIKWFVPSEQTGREREDNAGDDKKAGEGLHVTLLTEISGACNGNLSAGSLLSTIADWRGRFFRSLGQFDRVECSMTKRSLIGHSCWAAVAVAAFAFGAMRDKGDSSSAGDLSSRTAGKSAGSRAQGASGSGSGSNPLSGRAGRSGVVRSGGGEFRAALTQEQLAGIAHQAFRSGNPLERRSAFGQLLESLTVENAGSILVLLKENKPDKDQWRDFHYAWGGLDGNAALGHAMKSKEYDLAYTMSGWAAANPHEARQFLQNLPEDVQTDRELLKRSLVAGMADRDTGLATDFVFELAAQGDRRAGDYLGEVTGEVLRSMGTEEAALWAQGLPDGELKGAAMDRVANNFVNRDPEAAAAWAQQFAGESYAARVIEEVGDEWAERNPVAAVDWLESLPSGRGQSMGLTSAYGEWSRRDPVAAGERIASMPRSPQRDSAISGYVSSLSYRDPAAAIEWANSIAQDSVRDRALTRAGQQLFRRDAEAARQWVATSGLSAEAQRAVLNPPRRR